MTTTPPAETVPETATTPVPRRRLRLVLLVLVPLLAAIIGVIFYLLGGRYVETDNAYVKADKVPISTEISGLVAEVLVQENQKVAAGQLLFRLDAAAFEVNKAQAEAKLAQVRSELAALKASYREKQAELELAKTQHGFALKQQRRQADLMTKHYTSTANFDDARQSAELAALKMTALKHDIVRIAENLAGGPDRPIESHPLYRAAQAELNRTKLDLEHVAVRAAAPGVVSNLPKTSQFLNAGTMAMILVETETPWVEANFTETDITHMQPGQAVTVHIDTYPDVEWSGTVDSLSPGTGAEFSVIPAQNATGNWVKITQRVPVRIRLNPTEGAPDLRAGLSARVEVDTGQTRRIAGMSL